MNHPLRENLEIHASDGGEWLRCSRCQHVHCRADQDWRTFCKTRLSSPTKAGRLMDTLAGCSVKSIVHHAACSWILI